MKYFRNYEKKNKHIILPVGHVFVDRSNFLCFAVNDAGKANNDRIWKLASFQKKALAHALSCMFYSLDLRHIELF